VKFGKNYYIKSIVKFLVLAISHTRLLTTRIGYKIEL